MSFAVTRQHPRFPVKITTAVALDNGQKHTCEAANLSAGGALLTLRQRLALYEPLTVYFAVGAQNHHFRLPAEVRSCIGRGGAYATGVRFLRDKPQDLERLKFVLQKEYERRAARRFAMRTRVLGRIDQPQTTQSDATERDEMQLFGRDVSLTGMRLLSEMPLKPGNAVEVNLRFRLGHQMMRSDSIVRWCKPDDKLERYEVGVEFKNIDHASQEFLHSLVSYAHR